MGRGKPGAGRLKVVNRHGQKVDPDRKISTFEEAAMIASKYNNIGTDDGPFTTMRWGVRHSWFSVEGHQEADAEEGSPDVDADAVRQLQRRL